MLSWITFAVLIWTAASSKAQGDEVSGRKLGAGLEKGGRFFTELGYAEIIEKDLGSRHEVCLVMVGPANWRDMPEDNLNGTVLTFVKTKTGRMVLDLAGRGFTDFATHGKGLRPVQDPPVAPDRSKVALVLQWWRYSDLVVYEIKGTEVREVEIELPDFRHVVAGQHPHITPTNSPRFVNMSVEWHGNSELKILQEGRIAIKEDEMRDDHEVTLQCTVRFKDGHAEVVPSTVWSSFEGKGPVKKAPQPDKDGRKTSHHKKIVSAKASEVNAIPAKADPAPAAPTTPSSRFSLWRPFGH